MYNIFLWYIYVPTRYKYSPKFNQLSLIIIMKIKFTNNIYIYIYIYIYRQFLSNHLSLII